MKIKRLFLFIFLFLLLIFCFTYKHSKKSKYTRSYIIYNLGNFPESLDPHLFSETLAMQVDDMIYEGLLREDQNGNLVGGVAEKWEEKENDLIFYLKKDVRWSDGSQITAYDFLYAFKRVLNPKTAATHADMLFYIKNAENFYKGSVSEKELGIKVIDEKTLIITLEKPTPFFKYILTLPISMPLKKSFFEEKIGSFALDINSFLYNGPYKIKTLKNGSEIFLEKNPYYWNEKQIKIPEIKLVTYSDYASLNSLIENNEIDMTRIDTESLEKYKKANTVDTFMNGRVWFIEFNLKDKYLKNKNLRKAITIGIDREKYVEKIKNDGSIVSKSIIGYNIKGYDKTFREENPDTEYFENNNLNEAKKYYNKALKELNVEKLSLTLLAGNSSTEIKEIQFLQEELRTKLDIEVKVEIVAFKDRLFRTRKGDFEMVLSTWSPKYNDPYTYLSKWYEKNDSSFDESFSIKYDDLIQTALNEKNLKLRMEILAKAEKLLISEAIISPLYFSAENHYRRNDISGIIRKPIGGITSFYYAYLKQ
ncbi:MAG: peptide ABC transporter substrate-binding protein [Sebaldella sp.]|nr:peptide ABC transporter substrate-binding protein [Sebaldella sp.]